MMPRRSRSPGRVGARRFHGTRSPERLHTKSPVPWADRRLLQPPRLECVRVHLLVVLHCRDAHRTGSGVPGVSGTRAAPRTQPRAGLGAHPPAATWRENGRRPGALPTWGGVGSGMPRCPSVASGTMPSSLHVSSYTWTLSEGSTSRPLRKLGATTRKPCSPMSNCTFTLCGGTVLSPPGTASPLPSPPAPPTTPPQGLEFKRGGRGDSNP